MIEPTSLIGAIIAAGKGTIDMATLPACIEKTKQKLTIPLLESPYVKPRNKFVFARSILEASLHHKLGAATCDDERLQLKQSHFQRVRKELEMNRPELEKQPATRADIAVLGLALQEVALCMDEHVNLFKQSGQNELGKFKEQTSKLVAEHQKIISSFKLKADESFELFRSDLTHFQADRKKLQLRIQELETMHAAFKKKMMAAAALFGLAAILISLFLR